MGLRVRRGRVSLGGWLVVDVVEWESWIVFGDGNIADHSGLESMSFV